jgi:dihydrofolate synthase/folylpolyglutamate synthase
VVVLEVGLGGRFDSTNVCEPMVSIITSISFDHTQMLGNTLAKIAFEKAGIIKPGRPTISGVRKPEARAVIERACRERDSALTRLDVDFHTRHEAAHVSQDGGPYARVWVTTRRREWPPMSVKLMGEHQARNAGLAIAAVEELNAQGFVIPDRAVADGLANVTWPARLEILARSPLVLLDCAHNVASAQALVDTLEQSFHLGRCRRILVFAGNQDKDLEGMLAILAPRFDRIVLTGFQTSQRCAAPEQLQKMLPVEYRANSTTCTDSRTAWSIARSEAGPDDFICVTGSVFLAGELRPVILQDC